MKDKVKIRFEELTRKVVDDDERVKIQYTLVFLIFFIVSGVFTIVNIITGYIPLMWSTLIFTILSLLNLVFTYIKNGFDIAARILFSLEIIVLCTFFVILGEPEGFSAIWSVLLPVGGMLLYRRKVGSIMALIQFLLLIVLFWTPFGRSLLHFKYTDSFMLRYPLLYIASFLLGLAFETIRSLTHKELKISRDKFENLSLVDGTTGMANEKAYIVAVSDIKQDIENNNAKFGIIIIDVNTLKLNNDLYGHDVGTLLLIDVANHITNTFSGCPTFRIGGDEFVALLLDDEVDKMEDYLKEIRYKVTYSVVEHKGSSIVLSAAVGSSIYSHGDSYLDVFDRADRDMYVNKEKIKTQYHLTKNTHR